MFRRQAGEGRLLHKHSTAGCAAQVRLKVNTSLGYNAGSLQRELAQVRFDGVHAVCNTQRAAKLHRSAVSRRWRARTRWMWMPEQLSSCMVRTPDNAS